VKIPTPPFRKAAAAIAWEVLPRRLLFADGLRNQAITLKTPVNECYRDITSTIVLRYRQPNVFIDLRLHSRPRLHLFAD
jgi:hypothetical protein